MEGQTENGHNGHNGNGNGHGPWASTLEVDALNRQVERGSLFTQASLARGFQRIDGLEQLVATVVRTLTAKGVVSQEELGVTIEDDVEEVEGVAEPYAPQPEDAQAEAATPPPSTTVGPGAGGIDWPTIALRVDDEAALSDPGEKVDCAARMHICQAVCCKLKFPLSVKEVDDRHVKWDIGHPYVIRHESNGMCTHNDPDNLGCQIYDNRPLVCRRYTCVNDTRIWKDFDNMVLNQEWIDEHVGRRDLPVHAVLPSMEYYDNPQNVPTDGEQFS